MHNAASLPSSPANAVIADKSRLHPLRALMDMWERDGVDEDEPAAEVSVMLAGMIGQQFFAIDQD